MSCAFAVLCLNFPENLLFVKQIGDDDPAGSGHKVLNEMLSMGLAVGHAPAEGKVVLKHFVAHVHKYGVHTLMKHTRESEVEDTMTTQKFTRKINIWQITFPIARRTILIHTVTEQTSTFTSNPKSTTVTVQSKAVLGKNCLLSFCVILMLTRIVERCP